jgi:hypothetical protein
MKETFRFRDDLPRKGWVWAGINDNEAGNFKCQNCHFPHVRYEHELKNNKTGLRITVGCVCAQHLTDDFTNPKLRERDLKGRAGRRWRWPTLNWRFSGKGNLYLKKSGKVIVLRRGPHGGWAVSYASKDSFDPEWISVGGWYDSADEAKLAAFDSIYPVNK